MLKEILLGSLAIAAGFSIAISVWFFPLPLSLKIIICVFGITFSSVSLHLLRGHLKLRLLPYFLCSSGLGLVLAAPTLTTPLFYAVANLLGFGEFNVVKELWQKWNGVSLQDLFHLVAGGLFAFLGTWQLRPPKNESSNEEKAVGVDEKLGAIWGEDTRAPGNHFYRDLKEVTQIINKLHRTATLWFSYKDKKVESTYFIKNIYESYDRWFVVLKVSDLKLEGRTAAQHVSGDVATAHEQMTEQRQKLLERGKLDV